MKLSFTSIVWIYSSVSNAAPSLGLGLAARDVSCTTTRYQKRNGPYYSTVAAASSAACSAICSADSDCVSALFNSYKNNCALQSAVYPLASGASDELVLFDCRLSNPPPSGTQILNGRLCTLTPTYDRAGGDYKNVPAQDFQSCATACGNDFKCVTAQFNKGNKNCYLKSASNAGTLSSTTDTVDCGNTQYINDSNGNPKQCTFYPDQDRVGHNISGAYSKTSSYQACAKTCAVNNQCVTAQYNRGNGYCYLKDRSSPLIASSNTDTVDCIPAPPAACPASPICSNKLNYNILCSTKWNLQYPYFFGTYTAGSASECASVAGPKAGNSNNQWTWTASNYSCSVWAFEQSGDTVRVADKGAVSGYTTGSC